MRILFTSDYLDPSNIGGAGRVILELAVRLLGRGHQVSLLTGGEQPGARPLEHRGLRLPWTVFPYRGGRGRGLGFLLRARRGIRGAYRSLAQGPELLVHSQPLSAAALGERGAPALYIFHSPWPLEHMAERFGEGSPARLSRLGPAALAQVALRRRIEARAVGRAAAVVTLSETMEEHARALYGLPGDRVTVLPGGVDGERFRPGDGAECEAIRSRWGISPGEILLVTARRLIRRTGVDLLLGALARVWDRVPPFRLLVAGTGPDRQALERLRGSLRLDDRVGFLGYISDEELPELYRAADLALMPTRALEGFGLSTLEALASGTPVAATPVGGSVEILKRLEPRLLARAAEPGALGDLLLEWLSDRQGLAELRPRCRSFAVDRYSWDRMALGVEALARTCAGPGDRAAVPEPEQAEPQGVP